MEPIEAIIVVGMLVWAIAAIVQGGRQSALKGEGVQRTYSD